MREFNIGDRAYFDYGQTLKRYPGDKGLFKEGDIVYTKVGPQLKLEVEGVKLKGFFGKVLDINFNRIGHYTEWKEFQIVSDSLGSLEYKERLLLDMLNSFD